MLCQIVYQHFPPSHKSMSHPLYVRPPPFPRPMAFALCLYPFNRRPAQSMHAMHDNAASYPQAQSKSTSPQVTHGARAYTKCVMLTRTARHRRASAALHGRDQQHTNGHGAHEGDGAMGAFKQLALSCTQALHPCIAASPRKAPRLRTAP